MDWFFILEYKIRKLFLFMYLYVYKLWFVNVFVLLFFMFCKFVDSSDIIYGGFCLFVIFIYGWLESVKFCFNIGIYMYICG